MKLSVRVTPNAKRDEIVGWRGEVLRVKVRAPAVGGRANAALTDLLAETLRIPRSSISILSGAASRMKILEVAAAPEVFEKLPDRQPTLDV